MNSEQISIHHVLAQINLGKVFSMKARYIQGKKIGAIYNKETVSKNFKSLLNTTIKKGSKSSFNYSLHEKDEIMLFDHLKGNPFSLPYWCIVEFNGLIVFHE